ncbi:hypothetical protein CYMTET_54747 [Cymbomonas tetramitiformis]|uniref:Uncharacterized protein n=1 Tax=Cymbomonas tetramitiformis TaxID=36881 RepID=A0AAE0ENP7_9CHLO|nr:hypothetical protein CYMTET_54747 [Cymbomonas tetramitiformis]
MLRGVISFYQSAATAVSSPVPGVDISIGPDCLETPPVLLQISIAYEGVGVGGAILSTHYQPTSVISADCETQVSLVDLGSDVFTQTEFIPQNLPRTPLARAEPREHARTIVQREVIHRYLDSRPAGSLAAGATAFQSPDDFSADHVDVFCGSEDGQGDSQNPPGYWDESDFSEEEYFSESAVSLSHLGVSQSGAPLEPGVDSFEEPADDSPLGESDISDNYGQSEAWHDEATDDYETAEGGYTAAEWEAWEASHNAHGHDRVDHQLYQGGPGFSDDSAVGGQSDFVDYDDEYGDAPWGLRLWWCLRWLR